jgi:hypothetical protein
MLDLSVMTVIRRQCYFLIRSMGGSSKTQFRANGVIWQVQAQPKKVINAVCSLFELHWSDWAAENHRNSE